MKNFDIRFQVYKLVVFLILVSLEFQSEAQTTPDGATPQFLFSDFSTANIKLKNGLSQSMLLNYNTVSEKMVYKKDDLLYDLVNTEMIDAVFLQDKIFVPVGKHFLQVVLIARVSLYVQMKGKVLSRGAQAGYGEPSQVSNTKSLSGIKLSMGYYNLKLPVDYTVKVDQVYWIGIDRKMYSFSTKREFLKLFPDIRDDLEKFITRNHIKFGKTTDLRLLVAHCNDLITPGIPIS